jgi:recombination protein RecA
MTIGQIEKQFGKGSVMRLGDSAHMEVEAIPTGALALDLALGVGGLPRGRVVEIFGPESSGKSTLAMHVVAEAQRNGGICAYIDAEHALDPVYARAIGVNIDDLLISQPDTGEQALEIADMLVRSGALDVVVIDSVAALTPRAEIEGEMGDSHVGLQARLMSQALRKLTATLNKANTIAIFINQLREKIGVMYGCFSYGTRVTLADGSQEKIGKIVNQRMAVEVLSYDPEAGAVVPKRVVNWFDNGRTDRFLQFTVARPGGNGRSQFACTPNHRIRTPGGWREAGELAVGDRVLQAVPHRLSEFQWEVVRGGLMGDGCLSMARNGQAARFRFGHGARPAPYAEWKASLLANIEATRSVRAGDGAVSYDFTPLPELAALRRSVHVDGRKVFDDEFLKRLTPLSLAIWYMDDGSFALRAEGLQARTRDGSGRSEICVQAMEAETRDRLVAYLADVWGLRATQVSRAGKACLVFPHDETAKLHALIAPFVHPSMAYKLLPRYRGRFGVEPVLEPMRYELMPMPITKIATKPPTRSMHRFDIEVEGSHNYLADGVVVHNSPEVTPGGRALKFYSSIRLDIRRVESIKDGAEVVGNRVRVKVVKNKCLAAGTTVFDPTTGLTHRIEDLVERGDGTSVVAVDKRGTLHPRPIVARMDQGEHEVIGLRFGDTTLWATTDHRVLTDRGWREAGSLRVGDLVARPRRVGTFGAGEPLPPDHARLLGYLIGDGGATGKTPISFVNVHDALRADAAAIASSLGCDAHPRGDEVGFSRRPGERNGVLDLARWAGILGQSVPDTRIPAPFFAPDVSEQVVANLLFGLWETHGWVSREQTGGIRCGFTTTSEQLALQVHWLLLRWGIGSSVSVRHRKAQALSCWSVRVGAIDNVRLLADALPMWGPTGQVLLGEVARSELGRHRGSQRVYLSPTQTEPVLSYLRDRGVTPLVAAQLVGRDDGAPVRSFAEVLGASRLRRDRLQRLADALGSDFLHEVLQEDVWYDRVRAIAPSEWRRIYDIEVGELHSFVADGVVVSNCSSPFKQAEFDIGFGKGISREGSLLDVGVDLGLVRKSGAWYTYEGEQLGQGRENVKAFLIDNPEIMVEISERIRQAVGLNGGRGAGAAAARNGKGVADDEPITLD